MSGPKERKDIPLPDTARGAHMTLQSVKLRANGEDKARSPRFHLVPFCGITFDAAVKGLLCSTGLIVVWGPPKCGKSFFVFDLVMHVALGWPYRGRRVRQGNVVYCALEGCAAFKNRVEAFRQKHLAGYSSDVPFISLRRQCRSSPTRRRSLLQSAKRSGKLGLPSSSSIP